jgi:hypothetical protein
MLHFIIYGYALSNSLWLLTPMVSFNRLGTTPYEVEIISSNLLFSLTLGPIAYKKKIVMVIALWSSRRDHVINSDAVVLNHPYVQSSHLILKYQLNYQYVQLYL